MRFDYSNPLLYFSFRLVIEYVYPQQNPCLPSFSYPLVILLFVFIYLLIMQLI